MKKSRREFLKTVGALATSAAGLSIVPVLPVIAAASGVKAAVPGELCLLGPISSCTGTQIIPEDHPWRKDPAMLGNMVYHSTTNWSGPQGVSHA